MVVSNDSRLSVVQHTNNPDGIELTWSDGVSTRHLPFALRDSCPCVRCIHPASGQRLVDTLDLMRPVQARSLDWDGETLSVQWSDGHASRFSAEDLRTPDPTWGADPPLDLWDAEFQERIPRAVYSDVVLRESALLSWLDAVARFGFAVLHDVPCSRDEVARIAELFSYVRETNYGRVFDVRSVVDPSNLAYSSLPLGVHTDNPYRDPTPTLQLLHCLASDSTGGDTTLVDGFLVAEDLRREAPAAFDLLCIVPARFRYRDATTYLEATTPIISLNAAGEVAAIRFNNRSRLPFQLSPELVDDFYEAYLRLGSMLAAERYTVRVRLLPGDLVVMDNLRVLHGRTGFEDAGRRHLRGCYADRDSLRSRLVIARRRCEVLDYIFDRFEQRGDDAYIGEPVSMTEHMVQAARLAERDGAEPALIASALLHDIGHLLHDLPEDAAEHGIDTQHEEVGYRFLSEHFGSAIAEPVRLHVAAKRYLCAVNPSYRAQLSPASLDSLALQGGPMSETEVTQFEASPHAAAAVQLRMYDDRAKDPEAAPVSPTEFRAVLEAVIV